MRKLFRIILFATLDVAAVHEENKAAKVSSHGLDRATPPVTNRFRLLL